MFIFKYIYSNVLPSSLLCCLFIFQLPLLYAQQDPIKNTQILPNADSAIIDSLAEKADDKPKHKRGIGKNHSPRTAVILGLVIPGGGQIYNRRYWKLPIVYAGLGGLGYFAVYSGKKYTCYRKSYLAVVDSDPTTLNTCDPSLTESELKIRRDSYQKQFEYAIVGVAAFYLLSVADAFVDAHLMHFDISDDLSMSIRPSLQFNALAAQPLSQGWSGGLGLQFRWAKKAVPPNKSFF